jgi:hypothetical protein
LHSVFVVVFFFFFYRTILYPDPQLLALLQERLRSQFDSNGQLLVQGTTKHKKTMGKKREREREIEELGNTLVGDLEM